MSTCYCEGKGLMEQVLTGEFIEEVNERLSKPISIVHLQNGYALSPICADKMMGKKYLTTHYVDVTCRRCLMKIRRDKQNAL